MFISSSPATGSLPRRALAELAVPNEEVVVSGIG
jgi:hypothetical protein